VLALAVLLATNLFTTADLPAHGDHLRLMVVGDAGATHSALRAGMLAVQHDHRVDAILLVGDNFYPCGIHGLDDPQWTKITQHFGPVGVPIYPILGNHDYGDPQLHDGTLTTCGETDPEAEIDEQRLIPEWHFPARSYALRSPLVDIIMLDTQPIASGFDGSFRGSATAADEIAFLEQQLEASHAPWRIVAGHHTIYSSGEHGRTNDSLRSNMRELLPLLRSPETEADLYICGHDHDLELIGDRDARVRPLFLISGAGSGLDSMKTRSGVEPATIWPAPLRSIIGFAVIDITPLQLSVTFYDHIGHVRGGPFRMTRRLR
jgi:tartrate-resistant acid phosphatase type 5